MRAQVAPDFSVAAKGVDAEICANPDSIILQTYREVLEAETHVIRTALKKGKNPRVELRDPSQAEKYLAMGVKHFCIGWDVRILADWWDAKGAEMRKMLRSKPAKAKSAPAKAPARKGNGRDVVRGNYT